MPRKRVLTLKKKKNHTSNPRYMCNLQEYQIRFEDVRGYYIHRYHGGPKHKDLQGHWRKFEDCEKALILWIKKNDKTGLTRYPGCEPKQTNYTRTFLKV